MLSESNRNSSTNEDDRISALHRYNILDTPNEDEFDNITQLAALICNVPIAGIVLVDEQLLFLKSVIGTNLRSVSRENSFSNYVIQGDGLLEVSDTFKDDRFKLHPSVTSDPNIRFFAGTPLLDEQGFKLGMIYVCDVVPKVLTNEQRRGLDTLSKEIITHLTLKKKTADLEAKSKRFEEMLNLSTVSPEIHCILDYSGKILFINDAVTNILEYSVEEAVGLSMWGFCEREDIERVIRVVEDGLANKVKNFNVDFRIVSKTGIVRWLSWNMVAKEGRWYTYGRDVTESKRVENELMQLSFVASKVNNAIVINDANNHVTWVNAAFEKITGFTLEDLKGKRLGDLIAGPKTDLDLLERARELTKQNQSFTVDLLSYRKDKQPIWLSIYNTVVLNDDGEVDIEVEIILDITDKKKAEEELQILSLVASKTNTGVNISDEYGHTTWVNQSLERLIGYTLDELQGNQLGNVISKDETQRDLIESSRDKTKNRESYAIEVKATTKAGEPVWLSVSNTPIINDKGKVERQIDLITDITQRKQIEKELVESKEQALQLSEAKEMFLSVMSHEIRTPLNAVIGMTHLLIDNDPKESQIADLNILKFSSENLLHIINDILDFTKIETGNLQLESVPFNIKTLAIDSVNSLQVNAAAKGNVLDLYVDERIPELVLGDQTRLYQILMNLLGNAIKFTGYGKVALSISAGMESADDINIDFEVSDTGIGIPEDKLSYIFETFTQAKTDISRKYGGTGLGLAITKKLLKLYLSDIVVTSKEHAGTTFSFSICFKKLMADSKKVDLSKNQVSFEDKHILVVDDNEINILIASRILSKWGFNLDFASNGQEAIDMVMKKVYDLIFMDIKMPGIDGFETAVLIRDLDGDYFKSVPIIALTASTLQDEELKFKASGMNGHILKPFKPEEIREVIHSYFSK
ncbi:PAS domain S-box protein [Pedobacter metabolipauper]|uniref:histidine kinase n=1 Tax=Pedobacter metabolipauper TaxID=425513 RepID=A0A4R6SW59_9SPHI|nr:PAS domain S-box protein [Pedobacter metabolipauper]TDQ10050.1 PAS domain S-box-containing protein [Pedobacter metabolipauper]